MKRYLLKLTLLAMTTIMFIGISLTPIMASSPVFTGYRNLDDLYKHVKGFEGDPWGSDDYKIDENIFIPFYLICPKAYFSYSTVRNNWWMYDVNNSKPNSGLCTMIEYNNNFNGKKLHDISASKNSYSEDKPVNDDLSKVDLATIKGLFIATVNGHEIFYFAFDSQITSVEFLINGYYFRFHGIEDYSKDDPDYEDIQKLCNLESLGEIIKYYEWVTEHRSWGDVNGDFYFDDADVILLARYVGEWKVNIDTTAADINGDGFVDDADVILAARYVGNWKVSIWKMFDKE